MKYPFGKCIACKEETMFSIETATHKSKKLSATIIYCPLCEIVQNVEKDVTVEWLTEKQLNKKGWSNAND